MRVYPITVQPKPDRTPDADQNRALSNDTMNRESGAGTGTKRARDEAIRTARDSLCLIMAE